MDIKATVDIGNNMKELIEKFANSIGMTAEKIYPYYVKQSVISGWSDLSIILFTIITCGTITYIVNKTMQREKNPFDDEWGTAIIAVCFIVAGLTFLGGVINFSSIVTMISNPEYHAIHDLMADVSKFTGK